MCSGSQVWNRKRSTRGARRRQQIEFVTFWNVDRFWCDRSQRGGMRFYIPSCVACNCIVHHLYVRVLLCACLYSRRMCAVLFYPFANLLDPGASVPLFRGGFIAYPIVYIYLHLSMYPYPFMPVFFCVRVCARPCLYVRPSVVCFMIGLEHRFRHGKGYSSPG